MCESKLWGHVEKRVETTEVAHQVIIPWNSRMCLNYFYVSCHWHILGAQQVFIKLKNLTYSTGITANFVLSLAFTVEYCLIRWFAQIPLMVLVHEQSFPAVRHPLFPSFVLPHFLLLKLIFNCKISRGYCRKISKTQHKEEEKNSLLFPATWQ